MSCSLNEMKFMKVFTGEDSSTELLIPTPFVTLHKQLLSEKLNLQTEYSHYSWDVKMEERNGKHYIADGWPKFIKDNKLSMNYLLFELIKMSTFKVSAFNFINGCKEKLPSFHANARVDTRGSRFHFKLKRYHKYYVNIPKGFAKKAGLVAQRTRITLVDPSGENWPIGVIERHNPRRVQTWTGWNEFISAQNLILGSEISIESMAGSNDVFLVKVLKRVKMGELLTSIDKSKGRPSVIC